jgi:hypothetical protein
MKTISLEEVTGFVSKNIGEFHKSRVSRVKEIKFKEVLQKKNPYLFKAKNLLTAEKLIESILQAYLSSSEEELFGAFLEQLAIFIANKTVGGRKAHGSGIDLEFKHKGIVYIVSIKSGLNWGNSSQHKDLRENFKKAKIILKQSKSVKVVQPVIGCCYGKRKSKDDGICLTICGQEFWFFISGNKNLYTDIIEPLGHEARQNNQHYEEERAVLVNKFTAEFSKEFCIKGRINWKKLVQFNSGNLKED